MTSPPRFHDDLRRRLYIEALCFYRVFRFHDQNNHLRKAVTLLVVALWAALELLNAAPGLVPGTVTLPTEFTWLRLFVGLILARMWNIEIGNFTDMALRDGDDD